MKQKRITNMIWLVSLLGILLGSSACAYKTTPPGANIVFGTFTEPEGFGGSYISLQWKEGLTISIVDDSQLAHQSSSSGSTEDPVWRGQGRIRSQDGQDITWRVETKDGKAATFLINERPYDLTQGTLFFIMTDSDVPRVVQRQSSHNGICSDDESCQQVLKQDIAVLQFIQETLQSR